MKTQLFTLAFAMMISINGLFAENSKLNATPDQVTINELFAVSSEEASLEIQDWMTNNEQWNKNMELPVIDTVLEAEASLEIESWMTDNKLWQPKSTITFSGNSININGVVYKIYDYNNDKEQPLNIESWMLNDKMWKRYKFESTLAKKN